MSNTLKNMLKHSLGLEDNSQVEVNFHIDTDAEGNSTGDNPVNVSDAPDTGDKTQESLTEVSEAETEDDKNEDDLEELQEAQDSLESFSKVLKKYSKKGGISTEAYEIYNIGMRRILGGKNYEELYLPSMESFSASKLQGTFITLESHEAVIEQLRTISQEALSDIIANIKYTISKWLNAEKTLTEKAHSVMVMVNTANYEHSAGKTIEVNTAKGLKLKTLLTDPFQTEGEFVKQFNKTHEFYMQLRKATSYTNDEVARVMFGTDSWDLDSDKNRYIKIFGGKFLSTTPRTVEFYPIMRADGIARVPIISPSVAKDLLIKVIDILASKDGIKENLSELNTIRARQTQRIESKSNGGTISRSSSGEVIQTVNYTEPEVIEPEDIKKSYSALYDAQRLKIDICEETINYIALCMSNRFAQE